MSQNDVILLNNLITQVRADQNATEPVDKFFERFVFEQSLKDYGLDEEEFNSGHTGKGGDAGIDGFFTFVDNCLLREDTDINMFKREPQIDLHIIQASQEATFKESRIDRLNGSASHIFNHDFAITDLKRTYTEKLVSLIEIFRATQLKLSARHARINIMVWYVCAADTRTIHPNVIERTNVLTNTIRAYFPASLKLSVKFMGARELIEEADRRPSYSLTLKMLGQPIAPKDGQFVLLTTLADYCAFITDEKNALRSYLFESNVRDYQGDVEVNEDIRRTLDTGTKDLDFWHLNNGITILASKATPAVKQISLSDVQVVNGLQTSMEIYGYFKRNKFAIEDGRALLVRAIVTTKTDDIDKIIKATNFQTRVQDASLRATEVIQRDIERYFAQRGWYYDRRKNHYKNQGKPVDRIIGIPYLAQAVMAIALKEPNNARARPSSLIKANSEYKRVFNPDWPFGVYLFCATLMKQVDALLYRVEPNDRNAWARNFRYHLALTLTSNYVKNPAFTAAELSTSADSVSITSSAVNDAIDLLQQAALKYRAESSQQAILPDDRIAKSPDFDTFLETLLRSN